MSGGDECQLVPLSEPWFDRLGKAVFFIFGILGGEDNAKTIQRSPDYMMACLWSGLGEHKRSYLAALAKLPPDKEYMVSANWICMSSNCRQRLHKATCKAISRAMPIIHEGRALADENMAEEKQAAERAAA